MRTSARVGAAAAALALAMLAAAVRAANEPDKSNVEWRAYAGTNASLKYAPLDQITKDNVKNLRIAWRQSAMPPAIRAGRGTVPIPTNYQVTPLMAAGLLYAAAGDGSVVALNPATGAVVWSYVPPGVTAPAATNGTDQGAFRRAAPSGPPSEVLAGRSANRGVAYWSDGADGRVVAIAGQSRIALNAKSGALFGDFGDGGAVDLRKGYRAPAASFRWTSVPLVVRDVIIVGGAANAPDGHYLPGDVRAYDVRTGRLRWRFKVVPEFGELRHETWLKDSYPYSCG